MPDMMNPGDIAFPYLGSAGLYLQNVPKEINIGGFTIALYGVIIALGLFAGCTFMMRQAKASGHNPDIYLDFFIYAVIFGILGARVYYVVFTWDYYAAHPEKILAIREGGLAIYGGVIASALTAVVISRKHKVNLLEMLDNGVFCILTGQVIGRWGNFTNREAFGEYTSSALAMRLPLAAVRDSDISAHIREMIEPGTNYIQVHPTFLYESVWNLCLLILLTLYRKSGRCAFAGELVLLYLGGYGLGRFFIEGLRTDSLMVPGLPIRVSQAVGGILCIVMIVVECYMRCVWQKRQTGRISGR